MMSVLYAFPAQSNDQIVGLQRPIEEDKGYFEGQDLAMVVDLL